MTAYSLALKIDPTLDPLHRYTACKAMAKGYAESKKADKTRIAHAHAYCAEVINSYWNELSRLRGAKLKIKAIPASISLSKLPIDVLHVAEDTGKLVASFPVEDAGFLIGSIYTVMLPMGRRSSLGAYYTPPPLVARLLDQAEKAGFDFGRGSAIDPACGGGAFLAPIALRMWKSVGDGSPEWILRRVIKRIRGIELDPFAAWMSLVLLEAALMPLCIEAKRRVPNDVILIGDALAPRDINKFDLVIGNPPYGRVTLSKKMRELYSRSLYGHANLYGLFTDLALRLVKAGGVIAYLTPTSFLGGQYFKSLRDLLTDQAHPVAFDFVADREGVFDDVLQETLLTSFKVCESTEPAQVSLVIPMGLNATRIEPIGKFRVLDGGSPWLLPRTPSDGAFLTKICELPTRLADLGYAVSTGQLVWNRHKDQLKTQKTENSLPLIWAEAVSSTGFKFAADRRKHVPFIEVRDNQPHLITRTECVLVQRTTSKEQNRRLLAAVLPSSFISNHGGVVVENHLNMIFSINDPPLVSPATISALLNSQQVDRAFRCISGSVAVSAYELNSLPLPTLDQVMQLEKLVMRRASKKALEKVISSFYGVFEK